MAWSLYHRHISGAREARIRKQFGACIRRQEEAALTESQVDSEQEDIEEISASLESNVRANAVYLLEKLIGREVIDMDEARI